MLISIMGPHGNANSSTPPVRFRYGGRAPARLLVLAAAMGSAASTWSRIASKLTLYKVNRGFGASGWSARTQRTNALGLEHLQQRQARLGIAKACVPARHLALLEGLGRCVRAPSTSAEAVLPWPAYPRQTGEEREAGRVITKLTLYKVNRRLRRIGMERAHAANELALGLEHLQQRQAGLGIAKEDVRPGPAPGAGRSLSKSPGCRQALFLDDS